MPRRRSSFLWLLAASLLLCMPALTVTADDKEKADQPNVEDRYQIPDGDSAQLLEFIENLKSFRPSTREEAVEHQTKSPPAILKAAKRVMELEKEESSAAYQQALGYVLTDRVQNFQPDADAGQLYQDVTAYLSNRPELTRTDLSLGFSLARLLERSNEELAIQGYQELGALFAKSSNEEIARYGDKMVGSARRIQLPGKEMEITGKTVDGETFDIKAYRGKVVLVDYWATWCGPCIAELPNVKKNYDLYHDKGFEIVGISLDTDRSRLETFLDERDLPWVCLFEDGAGWDHSLATQYGVMSIPTVILLDKEGKVVNMRARGETLGSELERLLGPAEK